jgi:hypothetical protein
MIMSTFRSVFPHTSIWRGPEVAGFYLVGTEKPLHVPMDRFREAFEDEELRADILEWDNLVSSADALAGLLMLNESEVAEFVQDAPVITDDQPHTEFPLWRKLSSRAETTRYDATDVLKWKQAREGSLH